jgi:hypothetical protein
MSALMNRISDTGTVKVAMTMGVCIVFGVLSVLVALWDNGTVARGLLWAGAWSAVGWFLGFLFGIPRFLSTDTARTPQEPALEAAKRRLAEAEKAAKEVKESKADKSADDVKKADAAVADAQRHLEAVSAKNNNSRGGSLTVNTNLEQISDWLTKIIVGVSLVESQALLQRMHEMATFMARSMIGALHHMPDSAVHAASSPDVPAAVGPVVAAAAEAASAVCRDPCGVVMISPPLQAFHSMESVAYAVMLYFLATGLLGSYLLTRLYLQRVLDEAANQNGA